MKVTDKIMLSRPDFYCKVINIGVSVDDIMAAFTAYDWIDRKPEEMVKEFKKRTGYKRWANSKFYEIREKAFNHKFARALENLSALIEEVNNSYNIPGKGGINNPNLDQYYYLKYWADKKNIPVNYNETDQTKKEQFNFYTILIDIFAHKLENFNAYNAQNK